LVKTSATEKSVRGDFGVVKSPLTLLALNEYLDQLKTHRLMDKVELRICSSNLYHRLRISILSLYSRNFPLVNLDVLFCCCAR
jgi:hypothetical protein